MAVDVRFTTDPAEALARAGDRVQADPVRHNVMLTLLAARMAAGERIRFWWAEQDGAVLGVAFQSPESAPVLVGTLADAAVEPLARAVASASPAATAVNGTAVDVSRFAGAFATVTRRPVHPIEAQRLYEIRAVAPPAGVGGASRSATADDLDVLVDFVTGFEADTGGAVVDEDPAARARRYVDSAQLQLWDHDGAPCASAAVMGPEAGVARIGFVYTPPEHRGRGYASALVAELSSQVLAAGDRCILYTQLTNPVSNAIYQRIGYEPVDEVLRYGFS